MYVCMYVRMIYGTYLSLTYHLSLIFRLFISLLILSLLSFNLLITHWVTSYHNKYVIGRLLITQGMVMLAKHMYPSCWIIQHLPIEWRCLSSNVGTGYIDLQSLDALHPLVKPQLPSQLYQVHTPLNVIAWKQMLTTDHTDQHLVSYLVNGIKDGFRIGFDHTLCSAQLRSLGKNIGSAKCTMQQE